MDARNLRAYVRRVPANLRIRSFTLHFRTIRTQSSERQVDRLRLKARLSGSRAHYLACDRHVEVHELSARGTERMIMTPGLAVVAVRARNAEADFMHQPCVLQILQRIVD